MDDGELESYRRAGAISREARILGVGMVGAGVKLLDVAEEVEAYIRKKGAGLAFPINIGLNEVAAHYTPSSDDPLRFVAGDVVKIDVGAQVDGFIGDTAATVEVGTKNWQALIDASAKALRVATDMAGDSVMVGTIGAAIEHSIASSGYRSVANLTGHGLRRFNLHAGITIPNINDHSQTKLRNDMAVAIEPFATNGAGQVHNDKAGNIYRVLRDRPVRDEKAQALFDRVKADFGTLPFCERWCSAIDKDAPALLRNLVRHGQISSYSVLREVKGGMVSQTEHTIVIVGGKTEITT
jgi:methionyl aminopeptidase